MTSPPEPRPAADFGVVGRRSGTRNRCADPSFCWPRACVRGQWTTAAGTKCPVTTLTRCTLTSPGIPGSESGVWTRRRRAMCRVP